MEQKILLAQLKAFQTYLKNYNEDIKSRPRTNSNKKSQDYEDESFAIEDEMSWIRTRYNFLRQKIREQYPLILDTKPHFEDHTIAIGTMYREVSFILDTITDLDGLEPKKQSFKPNNQPFTKDEIELIQTKLDDLQSKLLGYLENQKLPQEKSILIETVKSEINDLKADVMNPQLGRKDWKNHLVNTVITLTLTFSFSQEARNTILIYFQTFLLYLQQHIFLLNSK